MQWEQVALLLRSLEPETREALLDHFSIEERLGIESVLSRLPDRAGHVDESLIRELISRLSGDLPPAPGSNANPFERCLENRDQSGILVGGPDAETLNDRGQDRLDGNGILYLDADPTSVSIAEPLVEMDAAPGSLAASLRDEHPQTIAAVMTVLPPEYATRVLQALPRETHENVRDRMKSARSAHVALLKSIVQELARWHGSQRSCEARHSKGRILVAGSVAFLLFWLWTTGEARAEPPPSVAQRLSASMDSNQHQVALPSDRNTQTDFTVLCADWLSRPGGQQTLKTAGSMALVGLIPALVLATTSFVRISVVLAILRLAFGPAQLISAHVVTVLSLVLTLTVMAPVWRQVYDEGVEPYQSSNGQMDFHVAWSRGVEPIRDFMAHQIEASNNFDDVRLFLQYTAPAETTPGSLAEVPTSALLPAFLISELRTAFYIGFRIFLPFLMIDLIVASLTASLGLLMLTPATISLPLKLIVFVAADGWHLVVQSLLRSFSTVSGFG
jgi:flagellar biosynthetic protein FliP